MPVKCGRPTKGTEQLSQERLLETAKQLFLEYSYANLTMETIAKEAHVSLRTIYNLFGGKAGLFGAVIKQYGASFPNILSQSGDCAEVLTLFGVEFLKNMTQPDILRIRAILVAESPRFPELAQEFYQHGPGRTRVLLADFFKKHQANGFIIHVDPLFLADQYMSLLRGERYYRLQLGLEPSPDLKTVNEWAEDVTNLFLKGCIIS